MIYDRDCKVSDLIKKLKSIKREYGDVEVRLYDKYLRDYYDFTLYYDDKECTCNIAIMDEHCMHKPDQNDDNDKYGWLKGPSDVMFFRKPKSIDP